MGRGGGGGQWRATSKPGVVQREKEGWGAGADTGFRNGGGGGPGNC